MRADRSTIVLAMTLWAWLTMCGIGSFDGVASARAQPQAPPREVYKEIVLEIRLSKAVLYPGQTQHIEIWADLNPGKDGWVDVWCTGLGSTWAHPCAFAQTFFDMFLLSDYNTPGQWSKMYWHPNMYYNLEPPNFKGNFVDNIRCSQVITYPVPKDDTLPLFLWAIDWTPTVYSDEVVTIEIDGLQQGVYTEFTGGAWATNPITGTCCVPGECCTDMWYVVSQPVAFTIADAPCPADCDSSGTLYIDDFICFQTLFALGDLTADCDGDGALLIDDFICFQTAFVLGC